jgi:hypothetical protein
MAEVNQASPTASDSKTACAKPGNMSCIGRKQMDAVASMMKSG